MLQFSVLPHSDSNLKKNRLAINTANFGFIVPGVADGSEEFCTLLCGQGGCKCGTTPRGLHCIWSHYRKSN